MMDNNAQQMRAIAEQVYNQKTSAARFSSANADNHTHNGTDSPKISQSNILPGNKFIAEIVFTDDPGTGVLIITNGILNPTSISYYGIGQTPKTGVATEKATIVGNAQLGNCFQIGGTFGVSYPFPNNLLQANVSTTFTNVAGAWVPHVTADPFNLASVFDGSGTLVGQIQVTSWSSTSITLTAPTIATDWKLTGNIIIT